MDNGSPYHREEIVPRSNDTSPPHYPSHSEQEALLSTSGPSCSLYHGHALTEDFPWEERTPTRYREASSSQDIPLASIYGAQNDGPEDEDTPTTSSQRPAMPRASSAALSPEVPFLHRDQSPGPSLSHPLSRRANSMPSSSHQATTSSAPIAGPHIDRKRARPSATNAPAPQAQPSHTRKKRKVTLEESAEGAMSHVQAPRRGRDLSSRPRSKSGNVKQAKPDRGPTRTKWVFDGVLVPPLQDRQLWDEVSDCAPSSPLSSLPPSSPPQEQSQARGSPSLSDDYDTWEATVDPTDVRGLKQGDTPLSGRL